MAAELKFHRTDNTPWGFRLTGGADCDIPLTVIKVLEGSIADRSGLQVSDVIVRINDKPTADCTHAEAHALILEDENDLIFAVRRDFYDSEDDADENNNQVCNIIENNANQNGIEEKLKNHSSISSLTEDLIAEAISGEAEVIPGQNVLGVNFNKVDLSGSTILKVMEDHRKEDQIELKDRQWSTFLQKPQRPILQPKPKEIEQSKASPYQVIIKKQKRKNNMVIDKPQDMQTNTVDEEEITQEESPKVVDVDEDHILEECPYEQDLEHVKQLDELFENEGDQENVDIDNKIPDEIAHEEEQEEERCETPPVEEQLFEVQKQLEALAQLPSSIQDTLDAVTKQLCKILNVPHLRTEEENKLPDSIHSSRESSVDRIPEAEQSASDKENDISEQEENLGEADSLDISEQGSIFNEENNTEVEVTSNDFECDQDIEVDEDEQQRLLLEEEKILQQKRSMNPIEESHQRRLEQRPTVPLVPVQRPIILPGGRRWSQPDDALPARKKKSGMSDEKICETLDMYSETILGHTKGINFLKYQPPTKNLDYLQKSEVYKLIHDMEPPARGIATRPEIVASEQDYYSKIN